MRLLVWELYQESSEAMPPSELALATEASCRDSWQCNTRVQYAKRVSLADLWPHTGSISLCWEYSKSSIS